MPQCRATAVLYRFSLIRSGTGKLHSAFRAVRLSPSGRRDDAGIDVVSSRACRRSVFDPFRGPAGELVGRLGVRLLDDYLVLVCIRWPQYGRWRPDGVRRSGGGRSLVTTGLRIWIRRIGSCLLWSEPARSSGKDHRRRRKNAAVGEQFAEVVEDDDAVTQQAPALRRVGGNHPSCVVVWRACRGALWLVPTGPTPSTGGAGVVSVHHHSSQLMKLSVMN